MRKHLFVTIALASLLLAGFAGCSTTGGDIGGLFPAPKFLKGSIDNNIYTSKDKLFTIAVPHVQDSYEYKYMKVKEEYINHNDYVSFGPAAFDQSIYRVNVTMRATLGSMQPNFDTIAPELLSGSEQQIQKTYGTEPVVVQSSKIQINGRETYYWQLHQEVPAGILMSDRAVTLDHKIYVIDFKYAVALVWVQSSMDPSAIKNGLTAKQFADSLTLLLPTTPASSKITNDGMYRFSNHPVTVMSPAALCGTQGLIAYDSNTSVDFVAPDFLWQIAGDYALQVFPTPNTIKDQPSFVSETKKLYPPYMLNDRKTLGLNFKLTEVKELQIGGLPALQGIGVDEGKAVFVVTAVLQKSSVTLASVIYPIHAGTSPTDSIPWGCYQKFFESVHEME